jgi:hypothetical protein
VVGGRGRLLCAACRDLGLPWELGVRGRLPRCVFVSRGCPLCKLGVVMCVRVERLHTVSGSRFTANKTNPDTLVTVA